MGRSTQYCRSLGDGFIRTTGFSEGQGFRCGCIAGNRGENGAGIQTTAQGDSEIVSMSATPRHGLAEQIAQLGHGGIP